MTQCQWRSNSLIKVQRILITCLKVLLKMTKPKSQKNSLLKPMPQISARFAVVEEERQALPANYSYKIEMEEALKLMIINEQNASWPNKYAQLEEGGAVDTSSEIFQLNPVMEDDMIKMRIRLEYSHLLPAQTKFPIILPTQARIADLIIMHEHEQAFHTVPEQTRRNVRTKCWILGGKRIVMSVLQQLCMNPKCKKMASKTFAPANVTLTRRKNGCGMFSGKFGGSPWPT